MEINEVEKSEVVYKSFSNKILDLYKKRRAIIEGFLLKARQKKIEDLKIELHNLPEQK